MSDPKPQHTPSTPTFTNPILRGFNPDPTICTVPSTPTTPTRYYLSTSTFNYTPSCPIYTSTNLLTWTLIGHALTRPSQLTLRTAEPGAGSWASTLRYRVQEKRFYLITGIFTRYRPRTDERIFPRGFYVWTDDIWNDDAWSDPVYFDNPGRWGRAGAEETKVYLSTTTRIKHRDPQAKLKDFAIHVSEIDLHTGRTLTPPRVIRKSVSGVTEGSHILFKAPYYYLFVAEGGTEAGHQEWVFRSRDGVFGPWEGQGKPLWYNGPNEEVQRTGHADVFQDGEGRWWAVLLGVRPLIGVAMGRWLEPQLGRETFLVKVDWGEDRWPVFNEGGNITILTNGRDAILQTIQRGRTAELGWYTKHTPLTSFHSLTARPNHLRLHGTCYALSSPECPALLLRKQEEYAESFHATLDFGPTRVGYEAGVCVWWDEFSFAAIGVAGVADAGADAEGAVVRRVVWRKPTGSAGKSEVTSTITSPDASPVRLTASANNATYTLSLTKDSSVSSFSFGSEDLAVTPPVGMSFTGAMWGIYACGLGEPVLDPADFSEIYIKNGVLCKAGA
ncbi:Arabinanase/levansucrase/invertase [Byssothecium circinans]|uniref:Arabinanase/levansucrase/invertase n=1 Tax=Byssothecium circinans TaxID=147558 RepID=A0A6A5UDD0_9PLEO|nr:Arabinanase/levansucrase/invertase [Byssothecium circinans]